MNWIQVRLIVDRRALGVLEETLEALGAQSSSQKDADHEAWFESTPGETPPWARIEVYALFDAGSERTTIKSVVEEALGSAVLSPISFAEIEEQDWLSAWMKDFKPMRFGSRLWVCPSYAEPPDPLAVNLRLDPGHAFGTGTHQSTALCLHWLCSGELRGRSVLDYGCGSGILAIAALLLGARKAWACDIDSQALDVTAENAAHNGVSERLAVHLANELPDLRADLLIANILAEPLMELAPEFSRLQVRGAKLLLAGILDHQVAELLACYAGSYDMRVVDTRDDWVLLEGVRV